MRTDRHDIAEVERAPGWVRRDLDSKDAVVRIRAEEALAAMIADALNKQNDAEG